jgi:hypothetical protein
LAEWTTVDTNFLLKWPNKRGVARLDLSDHLITTRQATNYSLSRGGKPGTVLWSDICVHFDFSSFHWPQHATNCSTDKLWPPYFEKTVSYYSLGRNATRSPLFRDERFVLDPHPYSTRYKRRTLRSRIHCSKQEKEQDLHCSWDFCLLHFVVAIRSCVDKTTRLHAHAVSHRESCCGLPRSLSIRQIWYSSQSYYPPMSDELYHTAKVNCNSSGTLVTVARFALNTTLKL